MSKVDIAFTLNEDHSHPKELPTLNPDVVAEGLAQFMTLLKLQGVTGRLHINGLKMTFHEGTVFPAEIDTGDEEDDSSYLPGDELVLLGGAKDFRMDIREAGNNDKGELAHDIITQGYNATAGTSSNLG